LYGLIDCNHFYVSCERVFNPLLEGRPVVVLTGANGCVVARSPEAKKVGVPMGAPAFQCRDLFASQRVIALECNFSLYSDLSSRVMQVIDEAFPDNEVYSIDEAFIHVEDEKEIFNQAVMLRKRILQWTGIPVSIGLASTKTLAKVATEHSKKMTGVQVFRMDDPTPILKETDLKDIWGIGRGFNDTLRRQGIYTAWDLIQMDDPWIRKQLGVVGLRIAMELRGIPCFEIQEELPNKKSIICSRSFTNPLATFEDVAEAASCFVARAAVKLRNQDSVAGFVEVSISTNRFDEENYYANRLLIKIPELTAYTPLLIHYVKEGLRKIYRPDMLYKKVGVMLGDIQPAAHYQYTLFQTNPLIQAKQNAVMKIMDQLNHSCSHKTLFLGAEGVKGPLTHRTGTTSNYTSQWHELLVVKAK
jgi:DNA polymerase V